LITYFIIDGVILQNSLWILVSCYH